MTDSAPPEQCACERLGITPGVRGGKRCPGCPKAEPPVAPPPASPEPMPEPLINVGASTGPYWVRPDRLRALLATQGLHIVDAASAKVLEACEVAELTDFGYGPQLTVQSAERIATELARGKP